MNTNRHFSFARLALVMKRDLMENWKANLYRFLGPYAVILFVMLMGYMKISVNFAEFSSVIAGIFSYILFIGSTFMAAHMMETMDTQQKRISYLMLPATSLEKFISRALHVTVGFWVMTILALLLAEATRFLFLPLFDLPEAFHQSTLPGVLARLDILALEKTLMLEKIEGRRRRGQQRMRGLDGIIDSMDVSLRRLRDCEGQGSLGRCSP